jgi:hypothetical protein
MAAIDEVVTFFVTSKKLKPGDNSTPFTGWIARQQLFYIRRRGLAIGALVPAWLAAAGQPDLRARLESEYAALDAFLTSKVGKGSTKGPLLPVLGGSAAADKTPKHLDLADLAQRRTSESPASTTVKTRASDMSWSRLIKVHGIVWRAAALHPEIWTTVPSPANKTGTLAAGVLEEFLDRRLMTIERMQYQISREGEERDSDYLGAGALGWRRSIDKWGTSVSGPWKDGFRVRLFEYPRVSGSASKLQALVAPTNAGYIADPGTDVHLPHSHDTAADPTTPVASHQHWEWSSDKKTRLEWRVLHGSVPAASKIKYEWRIPAALHDDYIALAALHTTDPNDTFRIVLTPRAGNSGPKVVDAMFDMTRAVDNIWERSWLWCDQVICALHTVSMLFGLRRRLGIATADTLVDNLVKGIGLPPGASRPYVQIREVVGGDAASDKPLLHTHANSKHFQSTLASVDDLQLGDHVIFWNHTLYSLLAGGDWRLENAIVMSVDSEKSTGKTVKSGIRMQGHGTGVRFYGGFQQEIAVKIEDGLKAAQAEVKNKVVGAPSPTPTSLKFRDARLVEWMPYSALAAVLDKVAFTSSNVVSLRPWWAEIDPAKGDIDGGFSDPIEIARYVAAALPKTFAHRASPGAVYNPPPDTAKVYFPLFEPRFSVLRKTGGTLPNGDPATEKVSGWAAYFLWNEARSTLHNPPVRTPKLMDLVLMTGDLMPGLFLRPDKQFPLIRPRAFA